MADTSLDVLLREQIEYYRARASGYDEWFLRRGRYGLGPELNAQWFSEVAGVAAALDAFAPTGEVRELACGTGCWTEHLARHVCRVTAIDASPEVILLNRERVRLPTVRSVQADIFSWKPDRQHNTQHRRPDAGRECTVVKVSTTWLTSQAGCGRWAGTPTYEPRRSISATRTAGRSQKTAVKEGLMEGNPVLRKLGLAPTDRAVIIHADDIGMCHATLLAIEELFQAGLVSSASVMVPCPWFPAAASFCRDHRDLDFGVHLTVTSEWMAYRWGPLSTRDPATGLLDEDGYFFRTNAEVQARAKPSAVAAELAAQLDRALATGIDVTHIDTHMGTVAHPRFLRAYVALAVQHRLPLFLPRPAVAAAAAARRQALAHSEVEAMLFLVQELEARGVPLFDHFTALPLSDAAERIERARRTFDALPPGLSLFILHPAQDTPELRAICPDWPARVADYQAFTSQELQRHVRAAGIHVIGYKVLQELVRAG